MATVSEHIGVCADCREAVEELRAVRDGAAGLELIEPSPALWYRVQDSVGRRPARLRLGWAWVGAAAAVVLAAVVVGRRLPFGQVPPVGSAYALSPTREVASAELTAHYRAYLAGVDAAIVETEQALSENPSNPRVRMANIEARNARVRAMDQLCTGGE